MTARSPLVLLHGVTMSGLAWREVVPLLAEHHDVRTPTTMGHRGGRVPSRVPVTITDLVDDCERWLDQEGLDAPHLAGNSLGGWMALELARRGRAASVCAISPGGFWPPATADGGGRPPSAARVLRRAAELARRTRHVSPLALQLPVVRQRALAGVATRGSRVPADLAVEITRDLVACTVLEDALATTEHVAAMDPLPCPVRLVWAGEDRLFPPHRNGRRAQELLPAAAYVELPGLGHVPMLDDPAAVAEQVLVSTGALATDA
ncbi:alpha/beta fold hydrolase [Nocardioides sp. ChNu-153]|uniref:alpha/beta fold hydrolase n=3 Tax=unclassified Nocardioides TaxID=2615069 RepID=UPI002658FAA2|nr:alpha/beta hydrolase [Nocardioides sp. ChNu-153]